ncbi:hypothetical protein Gohar_006159 [Gossypium harknessii]|uniref:WDR36/Utp21 C-terminal domain-containing protein n=1 Tax=Gossypium harknessii TaxID=34285 RepID=A0A7J9GCK1_9ROSI|nr:hypothetical protein [Gossypium harknessii]
MELRMLQIIDDENLEDLDGKPEMISIELLLDYFVCEISYKNNFEFIQAVIRLFLKIHGETIRRHPKLQGKAKKLLEIQSDFCELNQIQSSLQNGYEFQLSILGWNCR